MFIKDLSIDLVYRSMMLCEEYKLHIMDFESMCKTICFPSKDKECCTKRLEEMKNLGIDYIYSFGKVVLEKEVNIVGKGHAAIVVLAHHVDHGLVTLKIRRTDSKRFSMEWEAYVLSKVIDTGFAPRLYGFSRSFLVREYIDGCTLEELTFFYEFKKRYLLEALKSLLIASLAMDLVGVDLVEISRPINQVVYLCCDPSRPFFVDFESAKISSRPLNVTKIISFVVSGSMGSTSVRDVIGLDSYAVQRLLSLAKGYKLSVDVAKRRSVVDKVLEVLEGVYSARS